MSVYKRCDNGKWIVDVTIDYPDGQRKEIRKTSPVQTKRGAEQYERKLREELLGGTFQKKEVPTLRQFAPLFIDNYARINNKPSTIIGKEKNLKVHLIPAFGRLRLDQIKTLNIEQYKGKKLKAGLSPKTINNHLTCLHKLLEVACEWEIINYAPKIKWLKSREPDFKFLNFDDADKLTDNADDDWQTMILTALKTGLRIGELLELRWPDINFHTAMMRVNRSIHRGYITSPKGGRSRDVPLCDDILEELRQHFHKRSDLVFCTKNGEQFSYGMCKWPLWRACDRAEVKRIGWHALRHTFASHLAMLGETPQAIKELLGHSDIRTTMRYMHLSPNVKRDAVQLLNRSRTIAAQRGWKILTS